MDMENRLNNLENRNNSLKSRLFKLQLKNGNYSNGYFKKYSLMILNEYKQHKSLFKASQNVGIGYDVVMDWYVQGQLGNPQFKSFYLSIRRINNYSNSQVNENHQISKTTDETAECDENPLNEKFIISPYGDGWSYKTYVNGEKIFIISNELETLKKKVKDRHLPLEE